MSRPPYAWDDEEPVRLTALRPLERSTGNPYYGKIIHHSDPDPPIGDFLDKLTGRWVRCTFDDYLRSIGWR